MRFSAPCKIFLLHDDGIWLSLTGGGRLHGPWLSVAGRYQLFVCERRLQFRKTWYRQFFFIRWYRHLARLNYSVVFSQVRNIALAHPFFFVLSRGYLQGKEESVRLLKIEAFRIHHRKMTHLASKGRTCIAPNSEPEI